MTSQGPIKDVLDLKSERLRGVHALWQELKPAGSIGPRRDDIGLSRLRGLAPWIYMIDVTEGGADFRFRIAGERIIEFLGRRYAGSLLSELRGQPFFDSLHEYLSACVTKTAPLGVGPEISTYAGKEHLQIEAVAMPLSEDGKTVTGLFGAFDFWPARTKP